MNTSFPLPNFAVVENGITRGEYTSISNARSAVGAAKARGKQYQIVDLTVQREKNAIKVAFYVDQNIRNKSIAAENLEARCITALISRLWLTAFDVPVINPNSPVSAPHQREARELFDLANIDRALTSRARSKANPQPVTFIDSRKTRKPRA